MTLKATDNQYSRLS